MLPHLPEEIENVCLGFCYCIYKIYSLFFDMNVLDNFSTRTTVQYVNSSRRDIFNQCMVYLMTSIKAYLMLFLPFFRWKPITWVLTNFIKNSKIFLVRTNQRDWPKKTKDTLWWVNIDVITILKFCLWNQFVFKHVVSEVKQLFTKDCQFLYPVYDYVYKQFWKRFRKKYAKSSLATYISGQNFFKVLVWLADFLKQFFTRGRWHFIVWNTYFGNWYNFSKKKQN